MLKKIDRKWKIVMLAVAAVLFVAAVAGATVFYLLHVADSEPEYTPPPSYEETIADVPPQIEPMAVANWEPLQRNPDDNTAVMSQMSAESAQVLLERGFRAVVLPAMEDMPTKLPPPAATIAGTECLMQSMVPTTLRSSTRRNSATFWR